MEPHSVDPAHELTAPRHPGVFGPLLWIDPTEGVVWQEAFAEQGTGARVLLVWVGLVVAVVSVEVRDGDLAFVSGALRAFLRRPELPVVFQRSWLPGKVGTLAIADAPAPVSRRELARAVAYVLVQSAWLDRERVTIELDAETFRFDVRESPDEEGPLITIVK